MLGWHHQHNGHEFEQTLGDSERQGSLMTNLDSILKQRHHFADKDPHSQSYDFSSSHVQMRELDHKEG